MATRATFLAEARVDLHDPDGTTWDDTKIYAIMAKVSREISDIEGLVQRVNLPITQYTKEFPISSVTDIRKIIGVYYNMSSLIKRNYEQFGNHIRVLISWTPTITSGTLAGTVTFTNDSYTVSGSGTAFSTELSVGELIAVSTASRFYRIAYIASATSLTLEEPFEEDTVTDTEDATLYRDANSCVQLKYRGTYTVDGDTCNLPAKTHTAFAAGIVAKAVDEYAHYYILTKMTGVTTLLSSASTAAGLISARLTQAATDITTVRADIEADLSSFNETMTDVETVLDQIDTDLTTGRALIETANPAGNVATTYSDYGKTQVEAAKERLEKARAYLESSKTSHDYVDYAATELNSAAQYANQAESYIKQAEQSINVEQIAKAYTAWANKKMKEYQDAKAALGVVFEDQTGTYSREN